MKRPLFAAVLAGCGAEDATTAASAQPSPAGTAGDGLAGGTAAAPGRPRPQTRRGKAGKAVTVTDISRIVVLNGGIAEIVFALGLGAKVVATDSAPRFPADVKALPTVGYQRTLSAESTLSADSIPSPAAHGGPGRGVGRGPRRAGADPSGGDAGGGAGHGQDPGGPGGQIRSMASALGVAAAGSGWH